MSRVLRRLPVRGSAPLDDDLRALAAAGSRAGIFCDFDGSLSPIVADPRRARALRGAPHTLERLARRYGVVAVVSGRPVSFLVERLHSRRVRLVGLYGVEERIGRRLEVLPEVQSARAAVDRTAARLRRELAAEKGVWVEHKGFSVSVHFRRAATPEESLARAEPLVASLAAEEGLASLIRGRLVLEVGPEVAVNKGEVVRRLVEERGLTAALVVGDDAGDIPMFDAVAGLHPALRIAVTSSEAPPDLLARADRTVDGPAGLLALFRSLARAARR